MAPLKSTSSVIRNICCFYFWRGQKKEARVLTWDGAQLRPTEKQPVQAGDYLNTLCSVNRSNSYIHSVQCLHKEVTATYSSWECFLLTCLRKNSTHLPPKPWPPVNNPSRKKLSTPGCLSSTTLRMETGQLSWPCALGKNHLTSLSHLNSGGPRGNV